MQWLLAGLGVSAFVLVLLAFPETAHSRGIDQVKEQRAQDQAARRSPIEPTLQDVEKDPLGLEAETAVVPVGGGSWIRRKVDGFAWVWLNPLAPIRLLLHPNILAMVSLSLWISRPVLPVIA